MPKPRTPATSTAAIAALVAERANAIYLLESALTFNMRSRVMELAFQKRVPVINAGAGSVFYYIASLFADRLRRSAALMDKVLKGAKPADLPVGQPTLFEWVVNQRAAKALGIASPGRSCCERAG